MSYSADSLRWAEEEADRPYIEADRAEALDQLEGVRRARTIEPIDPDASDRALCELAERRAELMLERIQDLCAPVTLAWLNKQIEGLEARALPPFDEALPQADQLAGAVKRVTCRLWWRRQIRRAAARKREAIAQASGQICVRTKQPYVTNDTLRRFVQSVERNEAMLKATSIENAAGEEITLWQAASASVANLAIRRGELMTRIRGAEEWATAAGMVGLFTTNTAPSRFHAMRYKGSKNPKYENREFGPIQPCDPKAAQGWLCKTWARTRSALQRAGVQVFGFRVAEPHHDACPHWHMLLWAKAEQVDELRAIMRAQWLADHPEEKGAQEHRVKFEAIDPAKGGAIAYVAKYIAKNIDDWGSVDKEGHRDEWADQVEIVEGGNKARRVMAWARTWGIRQFQAIGQPPVTVWRELRRVEPHMAQAASPTAREAHAACNKTESRRADWRRYIAAQGGAMKGRAYALKLAQEVEQRAGRYGPIMAQRVMGVFDVSRPGEWLISSRKEWKPKGAWAAGEAVELRGWGFEARPKAAPAWTRVNNCTRYMVSEDDILDMCLQQPDELMGLGIVGAINSRFKAPGGNERHYDPPRPERESRYIDRSGTDGPRIWRAT